MNSGMTASFIFIGLVAASFQAVSSANGRLVILEEGGGISSSWVESSSSWQQIVRVVLDRRQSQLSNHRLCEALEEGTHLVLDFTHDGEGWSNAKRAAVAAGLPYLRVRTIFSYLQHVAHQFLVKERKARDSAIIYQHRYQLESSLHYLVHHSPLRVVLFEGLGGDDIQRLQDMRPSPSYYLLFADTPSINSIYQSARHNMLADLNDRWNLVFTDFSYLDFDKSLIGPRAIAFTVNASLCCGFRSALPPCDCRQTDNIEEVFTREVMKCVEESLGDLSNEPPVSAQCLDTQVEAPNDEPKSTGPLTFYSKFRECLKRKRSMDVEGSDDVMVRADMEVMVRQWSKGGGDEVVEVMAATWKSPDGLTTLASLPPVKRFFRVGTGFSVPFGYPVIGRNGREALDNRGRPIWTGYCIDLIDRLSQLMNFDYELVTSHEFGHKDSNGTWNGLVGMLAYARIDLVVAPLTMTSEREEVIDFIAPYFEQTGLSILIRKPVREVSLFKFMTVLKVEVWLSILAALVSTALMIWFLDKYSPYSSRNNKQLYPYPCREFTLKESFWFAVTSFTPQGGGEAPKPLSARTLVAAYWLFVVLMLATFTANLAAFLTVERMKSPVQSLEQLAKQSRINYTVVKDSTAHLYFNNMKLAEDTLYRAWKEITLNASSDQIQYRVWDYPIKEQYSRILLAILKTGIVSTPEEGYEKVLASEQGEFALIHDALEIKYQVARNCNFTEIGEPFAEQPYAIAVQQGSQLNEEISRKILDLQRDRYLEELTAKYWNTSVRGECNDLDDNEGITLESLGGVFITTLVGLGLAIITLGGEVFYQRRKDKNKSQVKAVSPVPHKSVAFMQTAAADLLTAKELGPSFRQPSHPDRMHNPPSYITALNATHLY